MPDTFSWLSDLIGKPVVCCRACHMAYFPHIEDQVEEHEHESPEIFERMAAWHVAGDRYWREQDPTPKSQPQPDDQEGY